MTQSTEQAKSVCNVVELRQYTLYPGQRDALIELFDQEFVEAQEVAGMTVMGQFRDLDDADRFVWLRGFADMHSRQTALEAFYGGPVWQAHRIAANVTMMDSDNVLLLRPAWPGSGVLANELRRPLTAVGATTSGLLDARIFYLDKPAGSEVLQVCRQAMSPCLERAGARVLGWYVTETATNNFPRLSVREGEHVLVGLAMFENAPAFDAWIRSENWNRGVQPLIEPWLARPTEEHRLAPTARSAIHA